jgi:flagellar hook assembly protein FlgD
MTLRGVPAGSTVSVYAHGGALAKLLGIDSSGAATWDGTNQSGTPAGGGSYAVVVQGSGGSVTFAITVQ